MGVGDILVGALVAAVAAKPEILGNFLSNALDRFMPAPGQAVSAAEREARAEEIRQKGETERLRMKLDAERNDRPTPALVPAQDVREAQLLNEIRSSMMGLQDALRTAVSAPAASVDMDTAVQNHLNKTLEFAKMLGLKMPSEMEAAASRLRANAKTAGNNTPESLERSIEGVARILEKPITKVMGMVEMALAGKYRDVEARARAADARALEAETAAANARMFANAGPPTQVVYTTVGPMRLEVARGLPFVETTTGLMQSSVGMTDAGTVKINAGHVLTARGLVPVETFAHVVAPVPHQFMGGPHAVFDTLTASPPMVQPIPPAAPPPPPPPAAPPPPPPPPPAAPPPPPAAPPPPPPPDDEEMPDLGPVTFKR